MKKGTFIGKTKEEAIQAGLSALKVSLEQVKIEVIEEEKKGLFGLGSKDAKIEMTIIDDPLADAKRFLHEVFTSLGYELSIEHMPSEDGIVLNIIGPDLGIIIGRRGQTLDALQYLVNIVANRHADKHERFILDAENFRERRQKTLQQLSVKIANQVIKTKKSVALEPMSSHERKIIHTYLQDHPKVQTSSEGDDPNRYVIIRLK